MTSIPRPAVAVATCGLLLGLATPAYAAEPAPQATNVSYVNDQNPKHQLDVYQPPGEAPAEGRPFLVFIHGGAWIQNNKSEINTLAGIPTIRDAALKAGYVVASINYRYATQAPFPAQVYDVKAAIRFLRGNARKYGINPSRAVLAGDSAGGHLALLAAYTGDLAGTTGTLGEHTTQSNTVDGVIAVSAPTNLPTMFADRTLNGCPLGDVGADSPEGRLLARVDPTQSKTAKAASPAQWAAYGAVTHPTLRTVLIEGDKDCIVGTKQGERVATALRAYGGHVTRVVQPGTHVDAAIITSPESQSAITTLLSAPTK